MLRDFGTLAIASGYVLSGFVGGQLVKLEVSAGGFASAALINDGEDIASGGSDRGAKILRGANQQVFGTAVSATVKGTQAIYTTGLALDATVASGGVQSIFAGTAISTSLLSGSWQNIEGGTAISTTMSGGGIQEVFVGGVASDTIVRGGYQQVDAGGSATGSIITSKGLTFIEADASGDYAIVGSGGTMKVAGEAMNPIISGGLLDLVEGYSADGILGFASEVGVLQIEGTTMPKAPIRHLVKGDLIDLASVPFGSGNAVVLGGTVLRIAVRVPVTNLFSFVTGTFQLYGRFFSSKSFALADDGAGGTLVFLSAATTVSSGQTLAIGGATGSSQALASRALASQPLAGETVDGVDVLSGGTSGQRRRYGHQHDSRRGHIQHSGRWRCRYHRAQRRRHERQRRWRRDRYHDLEQRPRVGRRH